MDKKLKSKTTNPINAGPHNPHPHPPIYLHLSLRSRSVLDNGADRSGVATGVPRPVIPPPLPPSPPPLSPWWVHLQLYLLLHVEDVHTMSSKHIGWSKTCPSTIIYRRCNLRSSVALYSIVRPWCSYLGAYIDKQGGEGLPLACRPYYSPALGLTRWC